LHQDRATARKTGSLSVTVSNSDPAGYVVHSFAGDDPIKCKDHVRAKLGMPAWEPNRGNRHDHDPVVASYTYRNADGTPHLRVQRTVAKKFWQQQFNGTTWENGAPKERIPYRLPELLAADPAAPVYIVEGEKDADRLASLGFVVTTSSGGSNGKWPELSEPFAGRIVYIIPDNDDPGHKLCTARGATSARHRGQGGDRGIAGAGRADCGSRPRCL
jgi:hypothetical protein